MDKKMKKIGIVGGGITGLTAAYELSKAGQSVEVFEINNGLGGLASSFNIGSTSLERYYHHMFRTDKEMLNLFDELGLSSKLKWFWPRTSTYYQGKIYNFRSPMDLLKFSPLPLSNRLRFALFLARNIFSKKWQHLDKITAKDWVIKNAGRKTYEILWKPLMDSKFGRYSDKVAAAWLWSRFKARGESRDKTGKEMLGYLVGGGFAQFTDALGDRIKKAGGIIHLGSAVQSIESKTEGVSIKTEKGIYIFDEVIFTASPCRLAEVAKGLPKDYVERISALRAQGNICLVAEIDQSLSDIYWLNVNDASFPFVAVIEHTNFIPSEVYGGRHIIYLSRYIDPADPLFAKSDDEIVDLFAQALAKIFPAFNKLKIKKSYVFRSRESQHVPLVGYSGQIPSLQTPVPHLYLASFWQIYPADRGMNFSVKMGQEVASLVEDGTHGSS